MMTRMVLFVMALLCADVLLGLSGAVTESDRIPAEDYPLYDQVVTSTFLTSATQLVVIERLTRLRLSPDQEEPTTIGAFQEQEYFDGELPLDLIRTFISVNRAPSRLEGRFHFGVGYRFATGDQIEEPEVSLARPVTVAYARPVQASPRLERLAFSRVARNVRNDQALQYVEVLRPDGSGAGFLVWFRRQGQTWRQFDTAVAWTVQVEEDQEEDQEQEPEGEPNLAP